MQSHSELRSCLGYLIGFQQCFEMYRWALKATYYVAKAACSNRFSQRLLKVFRNLQHSPSVEIGCGGRP